MRAGEVLYVGKARHLKKRVQSYARGAGHNNRIARMIADTASMEFVTTATEIEALLLEANLIKRLKPRFNVVLRDDKSFPFILIARDHPVPQILKHRGARNRKGDYFGPFASAGAVGRTINTLQRAFLLRSCSDAYYETPGAPVPAVPDQALLGAVHRRDRGRGLRRAGRRGTRLPHRRERRGEAQAARADGRGEPEAGLRAGGELPRPVDRAQPHPVAPGHQSADGQGGRRVRRASGGGPDLHPGVLLPQRQQLGQPGLFPARRQEPRRGGGAGILHRPVLRRQAAAEAHPAFARHCDAPAARRGSVAARRTQDRA